MTPAQFDSLDEMEMVKTIAYNSRNLSKREDVEEKIQERPVDSFLSPIFFSTNVDIVLYLEKFADARWN